MRLILIALLFAACGGPVPRGTVISADPGPGAVMEAPLDGGAVDSDAPPDAAPLVVPDAAAQAVCHFGDSGIEIGVTCGSICTDTNTDQQNCGGCGYVCPAGPCVAALCKIGQYGLCNPSDNNCAPGLFCRLPPFGAAACETFQ